MAHATFRKRGEKRVTVFSGADAENEAILPQQSAASATSSYDLDQIRKGMTMAEVEMLLGRGDGDLHQMTGKFAIINYRFRESGIAVVYKDHRVVSRAFIS